jgi:uncharacterized protein (TIGR00369 family)
MTEPAKMTAEELTAFLAAGFARWERTGITIEAASRRAVRLKMTTGERSLRPGGTVSGPTMFMLADTALYVAVLASVGPKALAVTTSITINFLRRPAPRDLIAECRLLKLGKRLAVGEVTILSAGEDDPVAHATGTYSIPAD